ncbi:MAG: hypothetical protein IPM57_00360 [Oligoflexia bacterium]|nr:hypothetical protein [Oligoflexia bacterium]
MRKLYLTLVITLAASLVFVSFAKAQANSDARSASQTETFKPTEWLNDTFETGKFKFKYKVVESKKGVYELTAECESGGCGSLKKTKAIKPKRHDHFASIQEAAQSELKAMFGDVKEKESETKYEKLAEQKEKDKLKEKIENCELNLKGEQWKNAEDKAICVEVRLDELLKSGSEKDLEKAKILWSKAVTPQFIVDTLNNKSIETSWAMRLVQGFAALKSDGLSTTTAKINFAAYSYFDYSKALGKKIEEQIKSIQLDMSVGNLAQANNKFASLQKNAASYDATINSSRTVISKAGNSILSGNLPKMISSQTSLRTNMSKLQSQLNSKVRANNGLANAQKSSSDEFDFDFSLSSVGNSAAQSAATSANRSLTGSNNTENNCGYFDRALGEIRGFRGFDDGHCTNLPQTAPQLNLNQLQTQNPNNTNRFGNSFRNRGQGLRNSPRGG